MASSYKAYKEQYGKSALSRGLYASLSIAYMRFLMERVRDGETVQLPSGFGRICILGSPGLSYMDMERHRVARADWKRTYEMWARDPATKEAKQYAILLNTHTNGIVYRYVWLKSSARMTFCGSYKFKPVRDIKRLLCVSIQQGMQYPLFAKWNGLRKRRARARHAASGSERVAATGG